MGVAANTAPRKEMGRTPTAATPVFLRDNGPEGSLDHDWVRTVLGRKLGKFATRLDRVTVTVKDESGPIGRPTVRATITLSVARKEPIAARALAASSKAAVSEALEAVERTMRRTVERARG
jgi:ribosome-associated translation inhibitor RaiA